MKKAILMGILGLMVVLASCKKEEDNSPGGNQSIDGSYKLKFISSHQNTSTEGSFGEKAVGITDFTTTNNNGTIVFNGTTLTATGLTYDVNTDMKVYLYDANILIDSTTLPFTFTLPPSNSTGTYQLIGADSIYFPQGSLTSGIGGSGSTQSGPSGGRYTISGNLLTITQRGLVDSTYQDSGETIHLTGDILANIVLEKQ